MTIQEKKQTLRKFMIKKLLQSNNVACSKHFFKKLQVLECWKNAKHVMLYYPMKDEINVLDFMADTTKQFYFPKVVEDKLMIYKEKNLQCFHESSFGIMEPDNQNHKFYDLSILDLIIVPGIAFDVKGNRLGRGKGYYDRFLSYLKNKNNTFQTLACAHQFQILESIPVESHDVVLDVILGE